MKRHLIFILGLIYAGQVAGQDVQPTVYDSKYFDKLKWRNIGPLRGGRSLGSSGSPGRPNEYYFGATGGGLWKTTDGGQNWAVVKTGMLDDSDVFAIEIDKANPDHVIASACSGIYETRTAGQQWHKVNGIPFSARRTRDITQNPAKPKWHAGIQLVEAYYGRKQRCKCA